MKKTVVILLVALLAMSTLFAGGAPETSKSSGDDGKYVIALSQRRLAGSDWWKTLVRGAEDSAKDSGNVEFYYLDANGDTVQQNADINTLINRNVDAIIVNPNDQMGLTQSVNAAIEAGIPVISVNCALDESIASKIYGYVVEDEVAAGAEGGYLLAQKFTERFPGVTKTTGVAIGGLPGDGNTENREKGFKQGWAEWNQKNPDKAVEITWLPTLYGNWLPNDALTPMRDCATAHPELQVVVSLSCVMQAGIRTALESAGLWGDGIIEASYDGYQTTVKEMVDSPNGPIQSLTTNEPYSQGWDAIKMAIRAAEGHDREGTVYVKTVTCSPDDAEMFYDPSEILIIRRKVFGNN